MSTIEVNKITPVDGGTTVQIGESGDTINIPAGATFANAGTMTGVPAPTSGVAASAIDSGTIATARLGSGTASSSTFLRGDSTYAAVAAGLTLISTVNVTSTVNSISMNGVFTDDYTNYFFVFSDVLGGIDNQPIYLRFKDTSNGVLSASVYDYVNWGSNTSGSTVADYSANTSAIVLANNVNIGTSPTDGHCNFFGTFYAPRETSTTRGNPSVATMNWQSCYSRGGILYTNQSSATFDNGTAVGGIQVYGGGGGGPTYLDDGAFRIYGIEGS